MQATAATALRAEALTKRYGRVTAVSDLSFDVAAGEVVGMLGPNGAGKTTTLRMALGLVAPSAGEISIDGHSVLRERASALAGVGAIIEESHFYPYLSGLENLRQVARLRRMPGGDGPLRQALAEVGLGADGERPVRTYSLGMRQRLALALAVVQAPRLLILDEPMNGLDPAAIRELRDRLRQLAQAGTAILLSSHLLTEVEQLCERVILVDHGRMVGREVVDLAGQAATEVQVTVDDAVERALAVLAEAGMAARPGTAPGSVIVAVVGRAEVPKVVGSLVGSDVAVFGVEVRRPSLEDRYLAITGAAAESLQGVAR